MVYRYLSEDKQSMLLVYGLTKNIKYNGHKMGERANVNNSIKQPTRKQFKKKNPQE